MGGNLPAPDEQVLTWRKSSGIIRLRLQKGIPEAINLQRDEKQPSHWLPIELVQSAGAIAEEELHKSKDLARSAAGRERTPA